MHDYLSLVMMIQPIDEKSLILFDVSSEEKGRIVRQFNKALVNAQGDGTDVAQIFLKPLITEYAQWGDPALIYGLCLAREGSFKRAEGSFTYAVANVLGSEQYLTIAQEALRMVREDIKNPPEDLPPSDITDKIKAAKMSNGESPAKRQNFQAPILTRAQKEYEAPKMATVRERRDIMMRSGSVGDEMSDDHLNIEDVESYGDRLRRMTKIAAIIIAVAVVVLVVIFAVIPLMKTTVKGAQDTDKLAYLEMLLESNNSDPEVSEILAKYDLHFAEAEGREPTTTTTTLPTQLTLESQPATEETTTGLAPVIVAPEETTTSSESSEEG